MRILHLIIDHQVIERTLRIYENVFPGQNEVIVFADTYKHIINYQSSIRVNRKNYQEIAKRYDFTNVKYIVAHYLTFDMIDFIRLLPKNIHICWEIYGYDLYNQFLEKFGMVLYSDININDYKNHSFLLNHFPVLYELGLILKGHKSLTSYSAKKYFQYITSRLDSICVDCKNDLKLLEKYSGRSYNYFSFCNYSLKETLGNLYNKEFAHGKKILVGNSASFSNNHFYILKHLKLLNFQEALQLRLVLSYGGNRKYKNDIINAYSRSLEKANVEFITSYTPLDEYNRKFLDLNSMILSAWRQESIGTALLGLYLGIKVYMSVRSPLYSYYKDLGFIIYSIESDDFNHINEPLEQCYRIHNRNIVEKLYNDEVIKQNLINFFY